MEQIAPREGDSVGKDDEVQPAGVFDLMASVSQHRVMASETKNQLSLTPAPH